MYFIIPHSFQVIVAHTKLVPHSLPSEGTIRAPGYHSTAAIIGPVYGGAIVTTPFIIYNPPQFVEHQLVQYSVTTGAPIATPLKLLFTRFPPFIEAIVQRIQNYFSTYNHVSNENYPASPPKNKPVPPVTTNTTTLAPVSATNEMQTATTEEPTATEEPTTITEEPTTTAEEPTITTEEPTTTETPATTVTPTTTNPPLSNNAEPETGNGIYGVTNCDDITKTPTLIEEEESSRKEMSVANPLR
jgi:hypothetical protein